MNPEIRERNRKARLRQYIKEQNEERSRMGVTRSARYKQLTALIYYYRNPEKRASYLASKNEEDLIG